jgi:hypothetical protein
MATMIDLRLNETIFWVTVVATIFAAYVHHSFLRHELRLDGQIDRYTMGLLAFNIGSLVVEVLLIWRFILRAARVQGGPENL